MVCAYLFLNQLTKKSPISAASPGELVPTAAVAFLGGVVVAAVLLAPAWLLTSRLSRRKQPARAALTTFATPVLAVGVLVFADVTSYTATGIGLRSVDNRLFGLALAILATVLGLFLARALSSMPPRVLRITAITGLVLCLPAGWMMAHEISVDEAPTLSGAAADGPRQARNVVILSTDAVEAAHLSSYGYARTTTPFLDAHRDEFTVFHNTYTNAARTVGSITSMLTGRSPLTTDVVFPPDLLASPDAHKTLPYLLRNEGYFTANWTVRGFASGHLQNLAGAFDVDNGYVAADSWVERLPLGAGLPRWFALDASRSTRELVLDALGVVSLTNPFAEVGGTGGRRMTDEIRLRAVLREIRTIGARPFFINTHFMGTHGPRYRIDEPAFTSGRSQVEPWQDDFYDEAILRFDRIVRTVYQALAQTGHLDDTILVVTSDHGRRWSTVTRVPLMIRVPGRPGRIEHGHAERLDLAPTILGLTGYRAPSWMEGLDLMGPRRLPRDRTTLAADLRVLVEDRDVRNVGEKGPDLVVTAVRCGRYVIANVNGVVERGVVAGDTTDCTGAPAPPSMSVILRREGTSLAR